MRVFIVDDERLARDELRDLLRAHSNIEVVGEAANVPQALTLIGKVAPELLFLDIRMPEQDGFQLLEALEPPLPRVIFVTAFDQFALRAFEVNALDYLVKPVDPERLAAALERLPQHQSAPPPGPGEPRTTTPILSAEAKVFLRDGDRGWFVAVQEFVLLEAEGNSTRVHFGKERPLLPRSLAALEPRLPPELFFRANRAQIINLRSIETVEPWFSKALKVRLAGGREVEFSRRQALLFRETRGL